jgi:hypothetical protein
MSDSVNGNPPQPPSATASSERPKVVLDSTDSSQAANQQRTSATGSTTKKPSLEFLKWWLTESRNPDRDNKRVRMWEKMGWEVFQRKALLLAAAGDLRANDVPNALQLAATDIFVEKAQVFLDRRGKMMYWFGLGTSVLAVVTLVCAAIFIFRTDVKDLLHVQTSSDRVSNQYLTLLIVKTTTASAFVGTLVFFLISLSRALLHEATVLYSRRHSLRFGRLFVYLKSNEMTRDDLVAVFNWNAEFSTAFKDIHPENISKSPAAKITDAPVQMWKSGAETAKELFGMWIKHRETQQATSAAASGH